MGVVEVLRPAWSQTRHTVGRLGPGPQDGEASLRQACPTGSQFPAIEHVCGHDDLAEGATSVQGEVELQPGLPPAKPLHGVDVGHDTMWLQEAP